MFKTTLTLELFEGKWEWKHSCALLLCRIESAELTDRRIHVMNEVISGIRVIKMYAWEEAFKKVIAKIRK